MSTFTSRIVSSDPQAAVQWAGTIGDEALRNRQTGIGRARLVEIRSGERRLVDREFCFA